MSNNQVKDWAEFQKLVSELHMQSLSVFLSKIVFAFERPAF